MAPIVSTIEARPPAAGSRLAVTTRFGGAEQTSTLEVTEITAPGSWAVRGVDGPVRVIVSVTVEAGAQELPEAEGTSGEQRVAGRRPGRFGGGTPYLWLIPRLVSLGQIELHSFLGAPWARFQRLTVIAAYKSDPFVQADGAVITVEHPQKDDPYPRLPQAVKNDVDHAKGDAAAPELGRDPEVFQIALISRGVRLACNADEADWSGVNDTDMPISADKLVTPPVLAV